MKGLYFNMFFCSIFANVLTNCFLLSRYLTEVKFKCPVIVYNYPKGIKAFYMKVNPDNKTVAAMDVLVPKVGSFFMDEMLKSWMVQ